MTDNPGSRNSFIPCPIAGLMVVQRTRVEDSRGFLSRLFSAEAFETAGQRRPIAQINHTLTRRAGAVRGLHFQWPPHAEAKFVSCVRGEVYDVAVDLRSGSPTFLRWHAEVLSSGNGRSLLIPEGFAHGFQTLSPDCELIYLHSVAYRPLAEGAVNPLDPRLSIDWPLPIAELSDRDRGHPMLEPGFAGIGL